MSRYRAVFDRNGLLAEFEDEALTFLRPDYEPPLRSDLPKPMIMRDIEPYQNMINGKMIGSRSEHRELLKRHNCFEVGNETMETKLPAPKTDERRRILHQQLADVSDQQADDVLKQLRNP